MTTIQIQLIKRSWKIFQQIKPELVGDVVYSKLFADNPSLRKLFPGDMAIQYRKLIHMLNTIVARLDRLDEMHDEITAMAQRHTQYGVRPAHHKMVAKALLWTLEQGLGNDYNEEVKQAWISCYTALAERMINAGREKTLH